jgi:hypothetical protein
MGLRTAVFVLSMVSFCFAHAVQPDEGKAALSPAKKFGTVWHISGKVTAVGSDSVNERVLHEGDAVFVGEHFHASALGEAVLKTEDRGIVAIRPNTNFAIKTYAAEGKPTDSFTVNLISGSLRIISGWIAQTNRSGNKVITPTATVGIRGTDHEPYVISPELASSTANREGTYDKVNRGGTTLEVDDQKLDIDPGKVGFVRAQSKSMKSRALMTILMPVLLDKVPNFYVPGQFDAELDRYSQTAHEENLKALELNHKATIAPVADCSASVIGKTWLDQLDSSIARHDAKSIVAMFAPDAAIRANVKSSDGKMTSVDLGRDELAQSTIEAMKGLQDYKQRRIWTESKQVDSTASVCKRISIGSVVVEQGLQSGKPFRFESREDYIIELHSDKWMAVKAETTQK